MKSLDGLLDALRSLRSNKMRSVLTTLGIIIGVGAVIVMVSVGNGAKEQINAMIERLGANVMMVRPGFSGATYQIVPPPAAFSIARRTSASRSV